MVGMSVCEASPETIFPTLTVCSCNRRQIGNYEQPSKQIKSKVIDTGTFVLDTLWKQTLQLMERSEQLMRLMTHVCPRKITGRKTSTDQEDRDGDSRPPGDSQRTDSIPKSIPPIDPRNCGCHSASWIRNSSPERVPPGHRWQLLSPLNNCSKDENCPRSKTSLNSLHCVRCTDRRKRCPTPVAEARSRCSEGKTRHTSTTRSVGSSGPCFRQFGGGTYSALMMIILLVATLTGVSECCSSRSTPKPRHSPTHRPNVTFQTYACPPAYAAWFCLNGATCFTVKIQEAILYNCECAEGYMGPRCEFKDLDGTYLPGSERILLETAGVSSGACLAAVLIVALFGFLQLIRHVARSKRLSSADSNGKDLEVNDESGKHSFSFNNSIDHENFYSVSVVETPVEDKHSESKMEDSIPDECYCIMELSNEAYTFTAQNASVEREPPAGLHWLSQISNCEVNEWSSVISQSSFSPLVCSKLSGEQLTSERLGVDSNKYSSEIKFSKGGIGRESFCSRNSEVV